MAAPIRFLSQLVQMKDLYFLTKAASPFLPKRTMSFIADK
jgi:hypothetical protein